MDTLNTMSLANANKLQRAQKLLEALTQKDSIPILAYLRENANVDFLELLVNTGMESRKLEAQLEFLCETNLLLRQSSITETHYSLNLRLHEEMAAIGAKLAGYFTQDLPDH